MRAASMPGVSVVFRGQEPESGKKSFRYLSGMGVDFSDLYLDGAGCDGNRDYGGYYQIFKAGGKSNYRRI